MYYVYLLKSQKTDKLYIGYTSNLQKRYKEHSEGKVKSTSPFVPWKLVYYEAYHNNEKAKEREFKLKHFGQAYGHLKKRVGL
jgi:putative endonuclease